MWSPGLDQAPMFPQTTWTTAPNTILLDPAGGQWTTIPWTSNGLSTGSGWRPERAVDRGEDPGVCPGSVAVTVSSSDRAYSFGMRFFTSKPDVRPHPR